MFDALGPTCSAYVIAPATAASERESRGNPWRGSRAGQSRAEQGRAGQSRANIFGKQKRFTNSGWGLLAP
jgi:hypothetical protein